MPTRIRANARSVQPTERVASPRASTPRRVLRSRQGNAGVIVNLGEGSPSFIVARGQVSEPFTISRCTNKRCKTCISLNILKSIKSNVTHKTYEVINHTGENLHCQIQNTIYLLTCAICNIQYVGETALQLNQRMNIHRSSKVGCEHIIEHSKTSCSGHNYQYQILEKLPGTGYDQFGKLDLDMMKIRKEREEEWVKKLRTLYPYGLNEKLSGTKTYSKIVEKATGNIFPPLPRGGNRPVRSRGNRNNKTSATSCSDFFIILDDLFQNNLKNSFHEIRVILNNTKKKVLKEIAFHIMERDLYNFYESREQWYSYILDSIETKLYKPLVKVIRKAPKHVCSVRFVNKGLDDIHLSKIFTSPDVIECLPESLQHKDELPSVTYKLDPPIRNKILNYKDTVSSLNISFENGNPTCEELSPCDCHSSTFCDPHHGHIVTGDLRIIDNSKLRKLFAKGPNYRENRTINYNKCKQVIQESLDNFLVKMSSQNVHGQDSLTRWKDTIMKKVSDIVVDLKTRKKVQKTIPVLQDTTVKSYLEEFHKRFVVVPIDKASNNVAIICKKFYVSKLLDEVGLLNNLSSTYEHSQDNRNTPIINNLLLCEKYGLEVSETNKTLPLMYWMPKMHYSPSRARFIVASSNCSSKPLSRVVSMVFKLIFHQVQSFHRKSTFYKNYNRFWVIENSKPIIEKLNHINSKKGAKDISTFDFSTLYTKLPHDDLVKTLHSIIDFSCKAGNRKFISFSFGFAYWTRKRHGKQTFSISELKSVTEQLITQTYFEVGNLLFHQSIGIPMGIDPAPFWANLYLYKYESDFVTELMKSDKLRARKYLHATRFIDDQCNLNDLGEFGNSYHLIYPKDLQLKCEYQGNHATFLELDITITDGIFVYKLFDKRDGFPFNIIRMPDKRGNIPSHVFYGSIMSEFLRIARATLLYHDFLPRAVELFSRMISQGGLKFLVLRQIKRAISRYPIPFAKFSQSSDKIIADISNAYENKE